MDGSAKNVSDCQLSTSGSSEPIAYCAFLTDIILSLLPRTVLKGTDFDLTYPRPFKLTNKTMRATGAPEVKATKCIQERSKGEIEILSFRQVLHQPDRKYQTFFTMRRLHQ